MSDIHDRLINCFLAVFPTLPRAAIATATTSSVGEWNSLNGAALLIVIEEEFGVQVAPEDFDRFVSFESILDYLQKERSDGN